MKLFNAFVVAAVAFASSLSGVSAEEIIEIDFEGSIASTEPSVVAEFIADSAAELETALAEPVIDGGRRDLSAERRLDDVSSLPNCPGFNSNRRLAEITVWNGCKFDLIPGSSGTFWVESIVKESWEAPCDDEEHAGQTCQFFQFSFFARVPTNYNINDIKFRDRNGNIVTLEAALEIYVRDFIQKMDTRGEVKANGKIRQYLLASGVEGDPHFKTWSGTWFDFMGECDMKMVHAPHFDGEGKALDVDIRTKIRYDYSFVESAAIKLGNDTLEVASYGDYFLNGVAGATMPAFVGGYPVTHFNPSKKIHIFEVAIADNEKIVLKTFKDLVSVTVNEVEPKRFTGALGMSGSFDKFGKMVGRDGQTEITDPTDFANEWQIRSDEPMLFHVAKGPQHPEQCKLPTVSTSEKRRRLGEGLAREKAERACAHFSGEHFENCVYDVMAIGDIEIAQAGVY